MHSLPVFVRVSGRKVVIIGEGEAALAKRRLVERAGGVVVGARDAAEALLVIVAVDDAHVAADEAQFCRQQGKLVNVVDRPELCDFTMPAIIDRSPVLVAVGTGGASAGLAAALRQRLEKLLPPTIGSLAAALAAVRDTIRGRWPDAADRRHALQDALADGASLDPLSGRPGAEAVQAWLGAHDDMVGEALARIDLTSDDPDELTLRAARLLAGADQIWHDGSAPAAVLARARADAALFVAPQPPVPPYAGHVVWIDCSALS